VSPPRWWPTSGDQIAVDEEFAVGVGGERQEPDRVTDDQSHAVLARDGRPQRRSCVVVLVHVPDGAVAAREDDRVVRARIDRRQRLWIVQPLVRLVNLGDPVGGRLSHPLGVDGPLVDHRSGWRARSRHPPRRV